MKILKSFFFIVNVLFVFTMKTFAVATAMVSGNGWTNVLQSNTFQCVVLGIPAG